jgi:hypothetical protein
MIFQTITYLLEASTKEPTKKEILERVRVSLSEFGMSHFWYWGDNKLLCEYAVENKTTIKKVFNKFWTVQSTKAIDEFFINSMPVTH